MKTLFLLAGLALPFVAIPAQAECLDAHRVEKELKHDFHFETPEGKSPKFELCNERSTGFAALRTLLFLKDLPPLDAEKSVYNQNLITTPPYEFFRSRVKRVVIDERAESDSCPDGRLAYVGPIMREDKKIWVCPNAANYGVITLGSVLVHESRHAESADFNHVMCMAGPYDRQFSCDQSYEAGGSYAIGLEFLVKLSRTQSLDPEIRTRARALALADFTQRFNDLPLDLKRGVLLRDASGGALSFFDGTTEQAIGLSVPSGSVLSLQAGLPLIFDPAAGKAHLYAYAKDFSEPVSDVLTRRFADDLSPADRGDLRGVLYSNAYACLLLKKSLQCFTPDRELLTKDLGDLAPAGFLYSENSRLLGGAAAVLDVEGFAHQLPGDPAALARSDVKAWPRSSQALPFRAATRLGDGELTLKNDGSVEFFSYTKRSFTTVDALKGRQFRDLIGPFVWSPALKGL